MNAEQVQRLCKSSGGAWPASWRSTKPRSRFDREAAQTLATVCRIAANLDRYASWLSA